MSHLRRAIVAVLATAMTLALLSAPAAAAPSIRSRVSYTRPNPRVYMRGSGWGHGVGMSQYGAFAQSKHGRSYRQILRHYYTNIGIQERQMPGNMRVGLSSSLTLSNVDAITGRVPWRARVDGAWRTRWQPKGSRWTVKLGSSGRFVLRQGSDVKWRIGTSRLLAAFNWNVSSDGTRIEAYSPNLHDPPGAETSEYRADYKWGRLEYTPRSLNAQTFNLVLEIPSMELYLRGLAEMPAGWGDRGGMAALKAQAVVGRSFATQKHAKGLGDCRCHILATPADQHYLGYDHERVGAPWLRAVNNTAKVVATYNGTPIEAFYSSSHGGRSENLEDSWAYSATYGYLRSVDDPWSLRADSENPYRSWNFSVSNRSFADFVGSMAKVRQVKVVGARTAGGTPKTLRVSGVTSSGSLIQKDRSGRKDIVGVSLMDRYRGAGLRSQQIRRFGFAPYLDDDGSQYEYAIVFVHHAGIMKGVTATRFNKRGYVTRGAMAEYLYRTFSVPAAPDGEDYYNDDDGHPAEPEINALAHAGVFGGKAFKPNELLLRGALQTYLGRLGAVALPRDYFTDKASYRVRRANMADVLHRVVARYR